MIVDTSAVMAVVFREPGHEGVLARLGSREAVGIGAPSLLECGIVASARLRVDARGLLARFLHEAGIMIVPFGDEHYSAAMDAWWRFGKGRHPAALNLGDCMSYATAAVAGEPLLFVGEDFAKTDIRAA